MFTYRKELTPFMQRKKGSILLYQTFAFLMRVIDEKDTKLKADELRQKRMIFCPSGFNFNDRSIL